MTLVAMTLISVGVDKRAVALNPLACNTFHLAEVGERENMGQLGTEILLLMEHHLQWHIWECAGVPR